MKTFKQFIFFICILIRVGDLIAAESVGIYRQGPKRQLTKEEQAAEDKRQADERARFAAEQARQAAEKARMAAEREQLGLGSHRAEEANEFLRMKREAEAERDKFGPYDPKPKESDCPKTDYSDNQRTPAFLTKAQAEAALNTDVKSLLCRYHDGVKKITDVGCTQEEPSEYDLYEYDNAKKKIIKRNIPIKWRCNMTAICNKQRKIPCGVSTGTAQ